MKVEIVRYSEELRSDWNNLVADSLNGTFLHSREFFDHNPMNKLDDCSFIFYKKAKTIAVIPCNIYESDGKRILNSYLRSTYGGFVVSNEIRVEEAMEMVSLFVEKCREMNVNEVVVRNPFRIFNYNICDETDYAMWYYGFSIKFREVEISILLDSKEEIEKKYDDATRRNISKGKKNLLVKESGDFENYWKILEANLYERHGLKPVHNYGEFVNLLGLVGKEKIKLFIATKDDQMVGGIVVFLANSLVMHAQYIASDSNFQEYRPVNIITDYIIDWGIEHNYKYLNLGNPNEEKGKVINSGLCRFKESFAGRGVLRETMHLIL